MTAAPRAPRARLSRDVVVTFRPGTVAYTLTASAGAPLERFWSGPSGGWAWLIPREHLREGGRPIGSRDFLAHDIAHRGVYAPADAVETTTDEGDSA